MNYLLVFTLFTMLKASSSYDNDDESQSYIVHRIEKEHAQGLAQMSDTSALVSVNFNQAVANLQYLSSLFDPTRWSVCTVVKGDAYGHGTGLYALASAKIPTIHSLCFVDDWEADVVRSDRDNPRSKSFDLVRIRPSSFPNLQAGLSLDITEVVGTRDQLQALTKAMLARDAANSKKKLRKKKPQKKKVHVNIDTSMGRSGYWPWDALDPTADVRSYVNEILSSHPDFLITGFMTHMGQDDPTWIEGQVKKFLGAVCPVADMLAQRQKGVPITIHYANTRTIAVMLGSGKAWECDQALLSAAGKEQIRYMTRPGKASFGLLPPDVLAPGAPMDGTLENNLKPVLSFQTKVATISRVKAGRFLGYGTTKLARDSIIATIPIGWADGYPERVYENYGGGKTDALMIIESKYDTWQCLVNVMRNPNMNLMLLDLTECNYFATSDFPWITDEFIVTVFGPRLVTAVDVARWGKLPSPSLATTRVGKSRVPDIHLDVLCAGEICRDVKDLQNRHCHT